jgi:hypothetical protein
VALAYRAAACGLPGSTSRRQRIFAVTQIAASFVLLAGASMLITTLIALQTAQTGVDTRHVLAINVPCYVLRKKRPQQVLDFYKESIRRVDALPGVKKDRFRPDRFPGAMPPPASVCNSPPTVMFMPGAKRILARSGVSSLPDSLPRLGVPHPHRS